MSQKIIVPTLGESVTEATVSKWLKNQGDKVISDEPVVELETDKVNVEVPAPSDGTLESISVKEGETVNVGALLGLISDKILKPATKVSKNTKYNPPSKIKKETKIKTKEIISEPLILDNDLEESNKPLLLEEVHETKKEISKPAMSDKVSPAARKIAAEANINLNEVKGTGRNGTVLKEDIMSLMGTKPQPSERKIQYGPEERIRMTRLRQTIAKRLKEAQENAAMLTTFNEVDMQEVILMRSKYKDEFQKNIQLNLVLCPFLLRLAF